MGITTCREIVRRINISRPCDGLLSEYTARSQELIHCAGGQIIGIREILREEDFNISRGWGRTK